MAFFGIVLISLVTLLHIYVFWRVGSLPLCQRWLKRKLLIGICVAFWLIFVLSRVYGGNEYSFFTASLKIAGMHWMASLFILAVSFLLADLFCGFGFLFRKMAIRIRTVCMTFGIILIIIAHIQGFRAPVVENYEVAVHGLPVQLDGTKIAMMTDLHIREMVAESDWLNDRIDQVQALHPDFIFLVGDLFERESNPAEIIPIMQRLSAPLGVWAVRGNHDSFHFNRRDVPGETQSNRRDVTGEILAGAGIRLLSNEWVKISDGLVLAGVEDLTTSRRNPGEGEANLDRTLTNLPAHPTILLSHTPWLVDRAAAAGVTLMLSGHTHNGQIWPFSYLVRIVYPFVQGRYEINSMTLIVCRGTGTWGPRMRLWATSEITLITLRTKRPSE